MVKGEVKVCWRNGAIAVNWADVAALAVFFGFLTLNHRFAPSSADGFSAR
jgi:hypothetical protein